MPNKKTATSRSFDPKTKVTKEAPAHQHDIRSIIQTYRESGYLPPQKPDAYYGGFQSTDDFVSAYEAVQDAMEAFQQLPAHTRASFDNDPAKLLAFADNNDRKALEELGLVAPIEVETPPQAPDVPAPPSPGLPLGEDPPKSSQDT